MTIAARLHNDKSLSVAGEIVEVVPGFDDADMVDDGHELDDDMQIDDENGVEDFLSLLFGIDSKLVEVDQMRIDSTGNIFANEFVEGDTFRFTSGNKVIATEFKEGI